jgi:hypothetical protein
MTRSAGGSGYSGWCSWRWCGAWVPGHVTVDLAPHGRHRPRRLEDGRSYCSAGAVLPLAVLLAFFALGGGTLLFTLLLFAVLSVVMAAAVAGTVLLMELAVVPFLHAAMRPRPAVARDRP